MIVKFPLQVNQTESFLLAPADYLLTSHYIDKWILSSFPQQDYIPLKLYDDGINWLYDSTIL